MYLLKTYAEYVLLSAAAAGTYISLFSLEGAAPAVSLCLTQLVLILLKESGYFNHLGVFNVYPAAAPRERTLTPYLNQ